IFQVFTHLPRQLSIFRRRVLLLHAHAAGALRGVSVVAPVARVLRRAVVGVAGRRAGFSGLVHFLAVAMRVEDRVVPPAGRAGLAEIGRAVFGRRLWSAHGGPPAGIPGTSKNGAVKGENLKPER